MHLGTGQGRRILLPLDCGEEEMQTQEPLSALGTAQQEMERQSGVALETSLQEMQMRQCGVTLSALKTAQQDM